MTSVSNLLKGAVDLHVHAGPSVMPREVDAAEMMKKAVTAGYQAFVVKDHYFPTMMSAAIVQRHIGDGSVKVYGSIALNDAVGGLNLRAVDVAYAMGAKIVWMPTISTQNHIVSHAHGLKFPSSNGMKFEETALRYVDKHGKLDKRIPDILRYVADSGMILGTGHGSLPEIDALVEAACKAGVRNILVNHPLYMIGAGMADVKRWALMGAHIELNATVFVPESKFATLPVAAAAEVIKEVGVGRVVIDSDYGQKNNGCPVEGLRRFIELLVNEHAVSKEDIATMVKTNPRNLLGI